MATRYLDWWKQAEKDLNMLASLSNTVIPNGPVSLPPKQQNSCKLYTSSFIKKSGDTWWPKLPSWYSPEEGIDQPCR